MRTTLLAAFVASLACATRGAYPSAAMLDRPARPFDLAEAIVVAPAHLASAAARLGKRSIPPSAAMDKAGLRWRPELRGKPLVLVGNVGNNRALLPLYAAFLDATDAYHPGGDGFVVRKLVIPQSVLILGGSSDAGARRAIDAYAKAPSMPTTIELGGAAAKTIPHRLQPAAALNAWLYLLRGDPKYAARALEQLREQAGSPSGGFGASDYQLEPMARGYRMIAAHGLVPSEALLFFDNVWLRTLIADQRQYWRARSGRRIGSRHQTMGTSAFHFMARMLLQDSTPNAQARQLLAQWDRECRAYFDNALTTFHDEIEGIPSYHSVQPMMHWAIEMGRDDYLREQLPLAVARALAVTDSLRSYVGTGTYEEVRLGVARRGIMLGYPLSVWRYFQRDAELNWLCRRFEPRTGSWGYYTPWGAHSFALDMAEEREPVRRLGLQIVPLGAYRYKRLKESLPADRTFEKLSWRSGWSTDSAFMALQGWQGARADNQPPMDGNAILRYTSRGRIWLFANCRKAGPFYRNAVFVSRGAAATRPALACELIERREQDGVLMTATHLSGCNGATWTRRVWWVRGRYVIVADRVRFDEPGDYVVLCTWRSPQPARLVGRVWEAQAGGSAFQLVNVDDNMEQKAETGPLDGAALPYFLRQHRRVSAKAGDEVWFRNAFAVDEPLAAAPLGDAGLALRGVGAGHVVDGRMQWQAWSGELDGLTFVARGKASSTEAKPSGGAADAAIPLPRQRVAGITIRSEPEPSRGSLANLTDDLGSAYASASWPRGVEPELAIHMPQRERVWGIEFALPMAAGRNKLPPKLPQPFETKVNGKPTRFEPELDVQPLHKGTVYPFVRLVARGLAIDADTLRLNAPARALRRVRVYRAACGPPKIVHFEAVPRGRAVELVVATDREVAVFSEDGRALWRHAFAAAITCVRVGQQILVGTREAKLYCLSRDGRLQWTTSFLDVPELAGDCPTPYSITRLDDVIAVGNYARASFLSTDGRLLGATFAYGAFETGWLPQIGDLNGDGARESLLYNIWGTISIVDGKARKTIGYLPCPRGALRLLHQLRSVPGAAPRVLVVSENGARLVDAAARKALWTRPMSPIACAARFAGATAIATGEGFVLLLADDGVVKARTLLPEGAPLAMAAAGARLFVATRSQVQTLDAGLKPAGRLPIKATALAAFGERVWAVGARGAVARCSSPSRPVSGAQAR